MGKEFDIAIDRFDGGIVNDLRDKREAVCAITKHFDIYSSPNRLTPYRNTFSANASQSTHGIRKCVLYDGKLVCIGVTGNKLYVANDPFASNMNWGEFSPGTPSTGALDATMLVDYNKRAYGWKTSGGVIWRTQLDGTSSFSDTFKTISNAVPVCQGLVHSKDDMLYVPYTNTSTNTPVIARYNGGTDTWTDAAITLPTNTRISSICEYGNYLAIAVKPLYYGKSTVYLWDRDSSLATLSESIDFGFGDLQIIEEIEGDLIGILVVGAQGTSITPKIVFRRYNGSGASTFKEVELTSVGTTSVKNIKQKVGNRLYFLADLQIRGTNYAGIWSIARSETGGYALAFDKDPVISASVNSLSDFFIIGDYFYTAFNDGSSDVFSRNAATATYTKSSLYETTIINSGDYTKNLSLLGVTVTTEPLPADGQVILKYRIDSESSYTTIFTHSTDNSLGYSTTIIESTGAQLPADFREIQFMVESTGGAEITCISARFEEISSKAYG